MAITGEDFDEDEDETCRRFVLPALKVTAGWRDEQIRAQYPISKGRIRATALLFRQEAPLRADYLLEYSDGLPIAVVEAKRAHKNAADGLEQVKRYAELLDVPFGYATNGQQIIELDRTTGKIREISAFPAPAELWDRYRTVRDIPDGGPADVTTAPLDRTGTPADPRYYQRVAINRTVQAIARGEKRLLLVLATGTGKTLVAAQIVAKLWNSDWPGGRKPRVLYLADRSILVDQPKDDYFEPMFGGAVHKLGGGVAQLGRLIYFGLYQSLDSGDEVPPYERFRPDYFDFVIVDECHRGSAGEGSQWRKILEHFSEATQLGMTATPIGDKDADTYRYFGEPIYEYSLKQGIEDGFLAPYRVRKVRLNVDMTGWRPEPGQKDKYGNAIPDELYGPREYERVLAILDRTEEAARYLTDYLHRTDRMGKTIVFCENSEHAARMTEALHNANSDLVLRYDDYVCRITSADGPVGRVRLDDFRDVESREPVIAVTARLLSTGVDIPTVRNIVLFRRIGSMPEFKQIIGRGTRLFPPDKFAFDIIDFVDATRLFNDRRFDGPPLRVIRDDTDETGKIVDTTAEEPAEFDEVAEPPGSYETQDSGTFDGGPADSITDPDEIDEIRARGRRL